MTVVDDSALDRLLSNDDFEHLVEAARILSFAVSDHQAMVPSALVELLAAARACAGLAETSWFSPCLPPVAVEKESLGLLLRELSERKTP